MTKVCFFIASISKAGGTERACTQIANKLNELGYNVTIMSMYGADPFFDINPGVKTVALYARQYPFKFFFPLVIQKFRSNIAKIKPDILINVDSALYIYSFTASVGLNMRNIVWEHFNFNVALNTAIRKISRRLAAKYSDAVVTLTHKDKAYWESGLKCRALNVVIHNASPFDPLPVATDRGNIVLSAGRLTPQKGFDRLLEVWELVVKRKADLDWKLHIVGSGALKDELENTVKIKGLEGSVILIPATKEIESHYRKARIYCMTSRFEGFPMVLLEAQSFGLPLLSYDCETGPAEIINNNNGLLIKNGDAIAMADAIIQLIHDPRKLNLLSSGALANSANYHIDTIIDSWTELFRRVA
jgi:glycosyltransferase involved in cell wall biosynthesis